MFTATLPRAESTAHLRSWTRTAGYLQPVRQPRPLPSISNCHHIGSNRVLTAHAGAALSLKYARAQDLPSFPSSGGLKLASASAAASLAESNKKSFEHWTPGEIPHANTAAEKARD